ncbi:MAG TPA: HlyD family type I secretion periplasmic adaptor subunit [Burkholderiales bacterium]|nr:HlyD family type I secretion periplasmic adaptor subunit [Burkholderiales bacterium]
MKPKPSEEAASRLVRTGWWIVLGALAPIGTWMCLAPLSMAVVAPGFVRVDMNRRPVQHLEGGIVRAVLVRDGQRVKAGEPVLLLGDVRVDAERNRLAFRLDVERAALARYEAEQALAAHVAFPRSLLEQARADERVREVLAKETALFNTRRRSLLAEIALLEAQRVHVKEEIAALRAQIAQGESAYALHRRDLEQHRGLLADGFISPNRLSQIEAMVADYGSRLEERRSELARAEQRLVDSALRIQTLRNDYIQQASGEVKASAARVSEIEQELRKSEDAAARQVVTAPASGEVIDLRVNTPGAVIRPGEPIAEIVPAEARLLVEARIRPEDIANVHLEQRARVKFTAFKYRSAALAHGAVSYVSGDRLVDAATHMPYYTATVVVDPASLEDAGDIQVQAGMSAEVYIEGSSQTPLQYLLEPITTTVRRAGRQM